MPSRHRLRYASTSNAPQALLNINSQNSLKGATAASSTSVTNSTTGISSISSLSSSASLSIGGAGNSVSPIHSGGTESLSRHQQPQYQQQQHHHSHHNHPHLHQGVHSNCLGNCSGALPDDKQLRQAYLLTLTKEQLKIECRKRGQKTNGNRFELLQRLGIKMSQLQKKGQQQIDNSPRNRKNNSSNMDVNTKPSALSVGTQQRKANGSPNGSPPQQQQSTVLKKKTLKTNREKEREEREKLVLYRSPIKTIKYCSLELVTLTQIYGKKLLQHRALLAGLLVLAVFLSVLYNIPGRHQIVIDIIRKNTWFFVYWTGLGILSSVGLGTGLHTFLLYLGPHIASVTLAAYECNSLNFPKPPYPDDIICPDEGDLSQPPNLWNIMRKVRLEAFLWGAGTALGELPPYFMAKTARLSGYDPEDAEDIAAFEELKAKKDTKELSLVDRGKLFMERVVERVGFLGILACASIPNPLFDLAGITCGHFLVPFWTFFGATLIGKAIIKMHIQKVFVIIAFNESLIERAVNMLEIIPVFGNKLQEPFKRFLENQKHRLHRHQGARPTESGNLLSKIFEKFVICMVCYFVMSIVNSLAQSYHKRIHKKGKKVLKKVAKD